MSVDALSRAYKKAVDTKIAALEHDLGMGKAESYETYRNLTGQIRGLAQSRQIFLDTLRKYADLEEDDDE